jgi:hypothetical protein
MSKARDLGSLINSTAAGKNFVINGDFNINQRNATSTTSAWAFLADRWKTTSFSGSATWSISTIAENIFSNQTSNKAIRITSSSSSNDHGFQQSMEDVRSLAGQTVTVSFWARSSGTSYTVDLVELMQYFGSGGSANVYTYGSTSGKTITSSWSRLSFNITLPSISGKTIGPGNYLNLRIDPVTVLPSGEWIEITHVQLEAGSSATAFSLSSGDIQGELAKCQRYYQRMSGAGSGVIGSKNNATTTYFIVPLKVNMRSAPSMASSAVGELVLSALNGSTTYAATSFSSNRSSPWSASFGIGQGTSDGGTGDAGILLLDSANGWVEFSAEL